MPCFPLDIFSLRFSMPSKSISMRGGFSCFFFSSSALSCSWSPSRCTGLGCGESGFGWWYGFGKGSSPRAFGHDGAGGQIAWADPDSGLSFCYLTNGLDQNILREKRRTLGIGSRAAALIA